MPASDTSALQVCTSPPPLTKIERRDFNRDERAVARNLKSFLDLGLALKDIRDRRLYREQYGTFEEYCAQRWGISRPRGYELCAAAEVVKDLSAVADIQVLPENEFQTRPLTRLKSPHHRKRAWVLALKLAKTEGHPVTARDVETAVVTVNGKYRSIPVNGVPMFDRVGGMRVAYADPPYLGQAKKHYKCPEVDHHDLIGRLEKFDAWALSVSSTSLQELLPLCPEGVRVGAWVKPFAVFKRGVNPAYAWEAVIFRLGRERTRQQPTIRDWVSANITLKRAVVGAKPDAFCFWIFDMLNLRPGDAFHDLFEGSGAVTRAFRTWVSEMRSAKRPA
jgi:hypothetical protein